MQITNPENGKLLDGLQLAQVIDLDDPRRLGRVRIHDKVKNTFFWAFVVAGFAIRGCEVVYAFHVNDPTQVFIIDNAPNQ